MEKAKHFKGIDYIQVSELPQEEQDQIQNWLSNEVKIKILTPEGLKSDCVLYKDYKYWYDSIYTAIKPVEADEPQKMKRKRLGGLAFDR